VPIKAKLVPTVEVLAESLEDHKLGRRGSGHLWERERERERERWVTPTFGTRIPRTTALDPALGNRSLDPSTSLHDILFQKLLIAKIMSWLIHCIMQRSF